MAKIFKENEDVEAAIAGPMSQTERSQSIWGKISQKSNELKYYEQITGAMIRFPGITGDDVDDLKLLKHLSNVRDLYAGVLDDFKQRFFKDVKGQKDLSFMSSSVAELVGNIVKESWEVSNGDYAKAKKLCDNAVFFMDSLIEAVPKLNAKSVFIDLPDNLEDAFISTNLIMPCVSTLIGIKGLDEASRALILGGGTIEELAEDIVQDIIDSTEGYIQKLCSSSGTTLEELDRKQLNISYARARGSIKKAYGNILEGDFKRMVSTGEFSDIYVQMQTTAEFFFPIIYDCNSPSQRKRNIKAAKAVENVNPGYKVNPLEISQALKSHCKENIKAFGSMPIEFNFKPNGGENITIDFEEFDKYLSKEDFEDINVLMNDGFLNPLENEATQELTQSAVENKKSIEQAPSPRENQPNKVDIQSLVGKKMDMSIFSEFSKPKDSPKRVN